jgi:uncharacterized protein
MIKKQILFIQGGGQGTYEAYKGLVTSLERELSTEYEIRYPRMPDENSPDYAMWKKQINEEISTMNGEVLLVGHSLGASLLLKYVSEEKIERPIVGLFLLASPYWGAEHWKAKEYALEENFATRLPKDLRIVFYHARDDEIVPVSHLALYKEKLPHATFLELDKGGHQFNNDLSRVAQNIQKL